MDQSACAAGFWVAIQNFICTVVVARSYDAFDHGIRSRDVSKQSRTCEHQMRKGCLSTTNNVNATNPTGPGSTTDQHCTHAVKCGQRQEHHTPTISEMNGQSRAEKCSRRRHPGPGHLEKTSQHKANREEGSRSGRADAGSQK